MNAHYVPRGHYGGTQLRPQPSAPAPLSPVAQALDLHTVEDVRAEYDAQHRGWSVGTAYHCCFCGRDFWSPSGARKHMRRHGGPAQHPVIRTDWYDDEVLRP
jgi:hypothetical protein